MCTGGGGEEQDEEAAGPTGAFEIQGAYEPDVLFWLVRLVAEAGRRVDAVILSAQGLLRAGEAGARRLAAALRAGDAGRRVATLCVDWAAPPAEAGEAAAARRLWAGLLGQLPGSVTRVKVALAGSAEVARAQLEALGTVLGEPAGDAGDAARALTLVLQHGTLTAEQEAELRGKVAAGACVPGVRAGCWVRELEVVRLAPPPPPHPDDD